MRTVVSLRATRFGVLDEALSRYQELASRVADGGAFRRNNDDLISGRRIVEQWRSGDRAFTWMGRQGGLRGAKLIEDVATGGWLDQLYEVRNDSLTGNPNWFPIESFVDAVQRLSR